MCKCRKIAPFTAELLNATCFSNDLSNGTEAQITPLENRIEQARRQDLPNFKSSVPFRQGKPKNGQWENVTPFYDPKCLTFSDEK